MNDRVDNSSAPSTETHGRSTIVEAQVDADLLVVLEGERHLESLGAGRTDARQTALESDLRRDCPGMCES